MLTLNQQLLPSRNDKSMIDKSDFSIIIELYKNSRASFNTIAEKLDVASGTVHNRYKKMQKKGIIDACSVNIDLSKFGYQCKIFLLLKMSKKEDKLTLIEKISKLSNILATARVVGDYDLFVVAIAKNMVDLNCMINKIRSLGIEQIEMSLSIRDTIPLLPDEPI